MPINTAEMRQKRHKLLEEARDLLNKAHAESRSLRADERSLYDHRSSPKAEEIRRRIDEAEERNDLEKQLALDELRKEDRRGDTKADGTPTGMTFTATATAARPVRLERISPTPRQRSHRPLNASSIHRFLLIQSARIARSCTTSPSSRIARYNQALA